MSATPDSTLTGQEQRIADLERQLAEREAERDEAQRNLNKATTERDEALAQQTATAEVLRIINSSPGHLKPVFDAMVEKALRLCDAQLGAVAIFDKDHYRAMSAVGPLELVEFVSNAVFVQPGGILDRMRRGENDAVQISDLAAFPPEQRTPGIVAMLEMGGARTALWVSLRKDNIALGFFAIYRQEVRPFSDKQIALLQNFAAQAVIAMENARLITETREALDQQTATAEVLQVINSSPGELKPVFETMLEKAVNLCSASFGLLMRYDGDALHAVAHHNSPSKFAEFLATPVRPAPGMASYRILRGEDVVTFGDIAADTSYSAESEAAGQLVELSGARSHLTVALRKDDVLLGVIVIYRQEVLPFTDKEIALVKNFAAQAVIAMENARLLTETREALEQQTATAEVLGVINSSPGNLDPVFNGILEKAHSLCGIAFGSLLIRDGEEFCVVAVRDPDDGSRYIRVRREQDRFRPPEGTPLWRVFEGARLVHLADATADDGYRSAPAYARLIDAGGVRTLLLVPLRKEDELLGAITAYRREVRPFTDKQIALLQNFAAQAVIAMENARLITETREALEQQTATAEVLQVINSSPGDLAPVFDAILERAHTLCGADRGALQIYDGELFWPAAMRGLPEAFAERLRQGFRVSDNPVGQALLAGERFIHIPDLIATHPELRATTELAGTRTLLCVPLRKDGILLGAIIAFRQEVRPFTDKQIALLQNFAAQAVIAMENARLLTETREALEQQTATSEVLQVINNSPGDLGPVFDALLDKALDLCGAAFGNLWTFDGKGFRAGAVRRVPAAYIDILSRETVAPRTGTVLGHIAAGRASAQIPDAALEDAYTSTDARTLVELGGGRTVVGVPLRKETSLLGAITIFRQEVKPFTEQQIEVLQNFAAQAVIAMENARLITETREALEQQTATAEVLQVINSSPGDLAPVFRSILEKAHALCDVAHGSLQLYDGEKFRAVAVHGLPEALVQRLMEGYSPNPSTPNYQLLEGAPFVQIVDLAESDLPLAQEVVKLVGTRTHLLVALRKEGTLLGQIVAARKEVRPFTDKQIALLQNFAAQAVIAMENARLITETREALEQQTATAEILQVINSSPGDLTPVFEAVLANAVGLCEAKFGTLYLCEEDAFRAVAMYNAPPAFAEARTRAPLRPPPDAPLGRVAATKQVTHIADIRTNRSYIERDPFVVDAAELGGFRTVLSVPMLKDKELIGAINVNRQEVRPFSDKQIALLQNFAAQAVIAMDNARLLGELRQRTDEVAELNRGLEARVAEQVDELGRVGRLKRFLAPQLAELIVSHGDENILESHRREIVVVFCDLRGYTAFTETAEPEEVLDFLRQYHGALGPLVSQFEGTLDQFSGDGIMVFFNDPVPCPDPAERAVKMAMAMRDAAGKLIAAWRRHGSELGFGAGIAQGYATLGQIGFSDRSGYTAIGTVCNLAARLCAEATDGQILVSSRIAEAVGAIARLEDLGNLELRGLRRPVAAFNVVQCNGAPDARPNLTVVTNGPGA